MPASTACCPVKAPANRPLLLLASVYEKPSAWPVLRPNRPHRLGPTLCLPPCSTVWHWAHFWTKTFFPLSTSPMVTYGRRSKMEVTLDSIMKARQTAWRRRSNIIPDIKFVMGFFLFLLRLPLSSRCLKTRWPWSDLRRSWNQHLPSKGINYWPLWHHRTSEKQPTDSFAFIFHNKKT